MIDESADDSDKGAYWCDQCTRGSTGGRLVIVFYEALS